MLLIESRIFRARCAFVSYARSGTVRGVGRGGVLRLSLGWIRIAGVAAGRVPTVEDLALWKGWCATNVSPRKSLRACYIGLTGWPPRCSCITLVSLTCRWSVSQGPFEIGIT
jgi:hypothetical protein